MNYKTNPLNHDFQITYFLAGRCHTLDGAQGHEAAQGES